MTVFRVMGIETEYGVLAPRIPGANPMQLSAHVVGAYRAMSRENRLRARWDYDDEDPLADARGFHLDRASAHPSLLTDDPTRPAPSGTASTEQGKAAGVQERQRPSYEPYDDPGAANVILTNGARLYVDHAHPEYSSPEVTNPLDGLLWDKAGELVMLAAQRSLASMPGMPQITLYKNNVDGKGATYGTHENYLMQRRVPFADVVRYIVPFLVTRQVYTGAGRVGIGQIGEGAGFQISQRADYMEAEVGLETTLRRPIVNTRDEPHADPDRYRRLHVIIGDANMLEVATYLKLGTTSLVLWAMEHLDLAASPLASLELADPVAEVHQVSHDLTLSHRLKLADGRSLTALEIQQTYLDRIEGALSSAGELDEHTADLVARWRSILTRLGTDLYSCAGEVEWLAKLRLLQGMRRRHSMEWDNPRLAAMDLQWSDIRPERGLYHRLLAAGAVEQLLDIETIGHAVLHPPVDTRAYFRGEVLARYGDEVSAASWDSIVFDIAGTDTLRRVPMLEPLRGTRAHVGELLQACPDASSLLSALTGT